MGIDYGRGQTNIDHKTKIRYGVISMHDVFQAWCDESELYYPCDSCDVPEEEREFGCDMCEPSSFYYEDDEYYAESCLDSDIMIIKSPFYTRGNFCSPCVPGAIDLNSTGMDGDDIAYCFGHDWFEDGKAPYRVFKVFDDSEVFPE